MLVFTVLFSGCFGLDSGEDALSGAKSDSSAKTAAASEPNFILLTEQDTAVPSEYVGKRAYLLAYNSGDDFIDKDYTGGAFLYNQKTAVPRNMLPLSVSDSSEHRVFSETGVSSCDSVHLERNIEIMRELKQLSAENRTVRSSAAARSAPARTNTPGETSMFYITYTDDGSDFQLKPFTLEKVGRYCKIWYYDDIQAGIINGVSVPDVKESDLTGRFTELAEKFDTVFRLEQIIFGSNVIKNASGDFISTPEKIDILIFDIDKDSYKEAAGDSYVSKMGYFCYPDVFTEEALSSFGTEYKTNQSECFYIDTIFLKNYPKKIYTTLVHEFQHLLNFINKVVNKDAVEMYETWYTEMLSQVAEEIFFPYMKIDFKDSGPFEKVCFFKYYGYLYGFFNWEEECIIQSYGNSYVFGSYLLHKYGIGFIRAVAHSPNVNKTAVTEALRSSGSPLDYTGAFYTWGKGVLDGTMNRKWSETLGGETVTVSGRDVFPEVLHNTEEGVYLQPWDLNPGGFYIVDMGTVCEGDFIYADSENMDRNVRMFVYFK